MRALPLHTITIYHLSPPLVGGTPFRGLIPEFAPQDRCYQELGYCSVPLSVGYQEDVCNAWPPFGPRS